MFSEEEMERMNKEYEEGGYREREIFDKFLVKIYEHNEKEPRNTSKKLENTLGVMYIHEKYYAIEGGSCWDGVDEDNNYEVLTSDKSVVAGLLNEVNWIVNKHLIGLTVDEDKLTDWIEKNVKSKSKYSYITDYHVNEYYGNSSTYGIYKIDFNTLIEAVCSDKEKKIYQETVENFKPPVKHKNRYY